MWYVCMYNLDKNKEQILRYKKINKCDVWTHMHTHIYIVYRYGYRSMYMYIQICRNRYADSRDVGSFLLHVNFK